MDWILLLYFLFIILASILSAIKEAQKKKLNVPRKIEPVIIERELEEEKFEKDKIREIQEKTGAELYDVKKALEEAKGNISKAIAILRERGVIIKKEEYKKPRTTLPKLEDKKVTPSPFKLEKEKPILFLEGNLERKLPEAIIIMEILGPPKAFQGFGPPYHRKYR